jgi:hypothetical protein
VETPPGYLMRLIRQIEVALSAGDARLADPKRWAYGLAEYEIVGNRAVRQSAGVADFN